MKPARGWRSGSRYLLAAALAFAAAVPLLARQTAGAAQQPTAPPAAAQSPSSTLPSCPELARAIDGAVRNDARLRDWANLARYRQANSDLAQPKADEARAVFMGDSITDMWQQPRFGTFFQGGKPYVDRGISGQTTPQMLVRFRPDVIALAPKVVVILAGTNDIAGNTGSMADEEIEGNLSSMADLAQAHNIRVVLSSILPTASYHRREPAPPQTAIRPLSRITAINDWMKKQAAARGFVYLDYYSAMVDQSGQLRAELSEDDLHPNGKGYAIMAPLADAAIARALK